MSEKLNPFYEMLQTEVPIIITSELKDIFDSVKKALSEACDLALKQTIPGKQLVLMADASFRKAGYALMIKDKPDEKLQSKQRTYAPVVFGSKIFSPAQHNFPYTQTNFWEPTWPFSSWHTFSGKQQRH